MISPTLTRAIAAPAGVLAFGVAIPPTIDDSVDVSTPVIVGFYVLGVALLAVAAVAHHRITRRHRFADQLRETSRAIYEFLADREQDDPVYGGASSLRPDNQSEGEEREWYRVRDERYHRWTRETMGRYRQRHESKALALFDQAVERGFAEREDRGVFEHPTNPLGVREVAQRLGAMAERL